MSFDIAPFPYEHAKAHYIPLSNRSRDLNIFQICDQMCNMQCIGLLPLLYEHFELKLNKSMATCYLELLHIEYFYSMHNSCDGRVVKALDSKSNWKFPRRFESCSLRSFLLRHWGFSLTEYPFSHGNILIEHRTLFFSPKSGKYKPEIVCPSLS